MMKTLIRRTVIKAFAAALIIGVAAPLAFLAGVPLAAVYGAAGGAGAAYGVVLGIPLALAFYRGLVERCG